MANLRVAVTSRVKDGDSWRDGDTSFYRVTCWRQLAEHAGDSLSKGDRVIVLGSLQQRSWETPQGDKRSVVEIQADEIGPSLKFAVAKPQRSSAKAAAGEPPAVAAVGLDLVAGRPGNQRRRDHLAAEVQAVQQAGQLIAGRAGRSHAD